MAKYMKPPAIKPKIRFYGKHFDVTLVFPEKLAYRLYRRLRKRFEKP